MTSKKALEGTELITCAKATAVHGIEETAKQCGYGEDCDRFFQALQHAGQEMGIEIQKFSDILTTSEIEAGKAKMRSL